LFRAGNVRSIANANRQAEHTDLPSIFSADGKDDRCPRGFCSSALPPALPRDRAGPPTDFAATFSHPGQTGGRAHMSALLSVSDVTKHYGALAALDRCSVSFERGRITGLIGPNGAGKTTLLNVIAGFSRPDSGKIYFDGVDVTGMPAHRLAARGLARTFQIARELANLTVLENLLLAATGTAGESVTRALFRRGALRRTDRTNAEHARELLARVGLWELADAPASALSGGQKKLLELARALMLAPRFILLDEPAAGVAPPLVTKLAALVRSLVGEGISFGIVEHDMDLIARLCDRVYVLAEGRTLVSGSFAEVAAHKDVLEAYLGQAA
jgi:ABC-type branched-subunit amino acid transport system ATPase component